MNLVNYFDLLRVTSLVIICSVLVACSEGAQPQHDQIKRYIELKLTDVLQIKDFEFKNFRSEAEGTGRTSVVGNAILKESIYREDFSLLSVELEKLGISSSDAEFYNATNGVLGKVSGFYVLEYKAGSTIKFNGDLQYRTMVDGIELSGSFSHVRIVGVPQAKLPQEAVVIGTKQFDEIVKKFTDARRIHATLQTGTMKEVEEIIKNQEFVMVDVSHTAMKKFSMKTADRVNWRTKYINELEFDLMATSVWQSDGRWANSHFQAG